ncbi:MAG TPA: Bax inhibitor-1/YccA family protein [Gemmatimonadaceae bacterium]|nr:Bax inhibitor-1/YccA family protein [Gemmatimonadaceae bacterium]
MARPFAHSSNPTLAPARFRDIAGEGRMTIAGTAWRALALMLVVIGSSAYTWWQLAADPAAAPTYIMGGAIGGLVLALVTTFKPTLAPWTAPLYAAVEGLALGALSLLVNAAYQGLPMMAVTLTFAVFAAMLALYAFRVIRVTDRLRSVIMSAVLGVLLFYVLDLILGFFGVRVPGLHEGGALGIGVSAVIVGIAAFSLLLDFDMIEQASRAGAPKRLEWYGAFGLIVTLVWLYIELLNLLRKLRD